MDLFLVQHGEAKSKAEDPDRPLTDRGVETVRRMAVWASQAGITLAQIRHSGKRRAEQTAEIFAERLNPSNGVIATEGLGPNDDVRAVADKLASETGPLMLVGHLPFLSRLTGLLLTGEPEAVVVRFRNAGVVGLRREAGRWSVNWAVPPELLM